MIPKIIHYCWFGPKAYSKTVRRCIETWQMHLADYELMLWNEQTCRQYATEHGVPNPLEHPFAQSAYAAGKYAFVADYVRFWALYYVGGVYLDTDMYVVRSFTPLLNAEFFGGFETAEGDAGHSANGTVSCGALGACALGACAREILAKYDTLHFEEAHIADYIVPHIITPIIARHPEATLYPYDYFYPFPYDQRQGGRFLSYCTENTYAIHLWDLSWGKWYAKWMSNIIYYLKKSYVYRRLHR